MPTRALLAITVAATMALGASIVGGPGSDFASAALSNCGSQWRYFDDAVATGISQMGASAQIDAVEPDLCDGGGGYPSFSNAWVMEEGSGTCDGWAQVGYEHDGPAGPFGPQWSVFTQFTSHAGIAGCHPDTHTAFYGITPATHTYKVMEWGNLYTDWLEMWYAGSWLVSTNFNPYTAWTGNWVPDFASETNYCESDVPGTAPGTTPGPVVFQNVKKEATDGTWNSINDLAIVNPDCSSRYHIAWVTQPSSFKIWTAPLN